MIKLCKLQPFMHVVLKYIENYFPYFLKTIFLFVLFMQFAKFQVLLKKGRKVLISSQQVVDLFFSSKLFNRFLTWQDNIFNRFRYLVRKELNINYISTSSCNIAMKLSNFIIFSTLNLSNNI